MVLRADVDGVSVSAAPPINIILVPPSREGDGDRGGRGQKRSKGERVRCSVSGCVKTFKRQYEQSRHIKSVHEKVPFPCEQCGKLFSCAWSVERHMEDSCGKNKRRGSKRKGREEGREE